MRCTPLLDRFENADVCGRYCLLVPVFYWPFWNKFKHLGDRGWHSYSAIVRGFSIARQLPIAFGATAWTELPPRKCALRQKVRSCRGIAAMVPVVLEVLVEKKN